MNLDGFKILMTLVIAACIIIAAVKIFNGIQIAQSLLAIGFAIVVLVQLWILDV